METDNCNEIEELMNKVGKTLVIESEYVNELGEMPKGCIRNFRSNLISIQKNNNSYNINVCVAINRKKISIDCEKRVALKELYSVAMDLIRFENLFEGMFYKIVSIILDQDELFSQMERFFVGYLKGNKITFHFNMSFRNDEYEKYYSEFIRFLEEHILQYQVSLFSTYLMDVPADLRIAQLLQVFEPLADELNKKYPDRISFTTTSTCQYNQPCPNCGFLVRFQPHHKKRYFSDKLKSIIDCYGKEIFEKDEVGEVIKRAVDSRNRIDHVNKMKKGMTGSECAHYLLKFSLLYRVVVMDEIGIAYDTLKTLVSAIICDYNDRFPIGRIKKTSI